MDDTEEKTLEEILATLTDTITLSSPSLENYTEAKGWSDPYYGAVPPLTVSNIDGNINGMSYSNISINGSMLQAGTSSNAIWTNGTGTSIGTGSPGMWTNTTGTGYIISPNTQLGLGNVQAGKVVIQGENADLVIGDKSMRDWMKQIEERLNLLTPNTALESEWEELRALGEQYRQLEQHIKDKQATWDRLKAMPPPVTE